MWRLRGKVLDVVNPGWRESPLIARVLANLERLRADPEAQRIRQQVDHESRREGRSTFWRMIMPMLCGIGALTTGMTAGALGVSPPIGFLINVVPAAGMMWCLMCR
jgi:hypothetical protein